MNVMMKLGWFLLGGITAGSAVAIYKNSSIHTNKGTLGEEIELTKLPQGSNEFTYPHDTKVTITKSADSYNFKVVSPKGTQTISGISGGNIQIRENNLEIVAKDNRLTVRKV
jgi:phage-related protein